MTKVLFFSQLRDITGTEELALAVTEESRVKDLLAQLYSKFPGLEAWDSKLHIAIDMEFADRESLVRDGQEIAIMPPMQGG